MSLLGLTDRILVLLVNTIRGVATTVLKWMYHIASHGPQTASLPISSKMQNASKAQINKHMQYVRAT